MTERYRTATGKELTDAELQALADEAEAGYPVGPCVEYLGKGRYCGEPALEILIDGQRKLLCSQHRKGYGIPERPLRHRPHEFVRRENADGGSADRKCVECGLGDDNPVHTSPKARGAHA